MLFISRNFFNFSVIVAHFEDFAFNYDEIDFKFCYELIKCFNLIALFTFLSSTLLHLQSMTDAVNFLTTLNPHYFDHQFQKVLSIVVISITLIDFNLLNLLSVPILLTAFSLNQIKVENQDYLLN
jgi:hypothetical protein